MQGRRRTSNSVDVFQWPRIADKKHGKISYSYWRRAVLLLTVTQEEKPLFPVSKVT